MTGGPVGLARLEHCASSSRKQIKMEPDIEGSSLVPASAMNKIAVRKQNVLTAQMYQGRVGRAAKKELTALFRHSHRSRTHLETCWTAEGHHAKGWRVGRVDPVPDDGVIRAKVCVPRLRLASPARDEQSDAGERSIVGRAEPLAHARNRFRQLLLEACQPIALVNCASELLAATQKIFERNEPAVRVWHWLIRNSFVLARFMLVGLLLARPLHRFKVSKNLLEIFLRIVGPQTVDELANTLLHPRLEQCLPSRIAIPEQRKTCRPHFSNADALRTKLPPGL
jgi:hypothetical protein